MHHRLCRSSLVFKTPVLCKFGDTDPEYDVPEWYGLQSFSNLLVEKRGSKWNGRTRGLSNEYLSKDLRLCTSIFESVFFAHTCLLFGDLVEERR